MALRKKGGDNSSDDEIRYYLEAYGIHSLSEDTIITPEDMAESGYKEIPDSHLGRIGMMFQQLPGLASHAISYHGTYRVYFDKSLGVLQPAKQGDGFLRANVVQAGTNNKITGQALLKSASMGPLVANAVFSALSMVTGQYFLSEINSKLSSIDKKVDGIRQFLEMEKISGLWANEEYLQQVVRDFKSIQENEYLKQATIIQLQQIRKDSLANTNFYSTSFQLKKEELQQLKKNGKKKEIVIAVSELGNLFLCYKYVLHTYCLAYYLETVLSGNMDEHYLSAVQDDIKSPINEYKKGVKTLETEFNAFFAEAKAYKPNEVVELITKAVAGGVSKAFFGSYFLGYSIAHTVNEKTDASKAKAKEEVISQAKSLVQQCKDYKPFDQISKSISQYDQIVNKSQIELVCSDDKTYIKVTDAESEHNEAGTDTDQK